MKEWNSPQCVADSLARWRGPTESCSYCFSKKKKKSKSKQTSGLLPQCAVDLVEFDGVSELKFAFRR